MLKIIILYCLLISSYSFKIISIKPGGLKGFYVLGICKFIKEVYPLDDCYFYGSSAGSWNAVYLSLPFDNSYYFNEIFKLKPQKIKTLYELELELKNIILNYIEINKLEYNVSSLNKKCNICLSEFKEYKFKKIIVNDFKDCEDLLETCIASSHLPLYSNGKFFYNYKNKKIIDGGLFRKNYPKHIQPDLIISHKIFKNKEIYKFSSSNNLDIEKLIYHGYKDAMENSDYFRTLLDY